MCKCNSSTFVPLARLGDAKIRVIRCSLTHLSLSISIRAGEKRRMLYGRLFGVRMLASSVSHTNTHTSICITKCLARSSVCVCACVVECALLLHFYFTQIHTLTHTHTHVADITIGIINISNESVAHKIVMYSATQSAYVRMERFPRARPFVYVSQQSCECCR